MARPGLLLYFDILPALDKLPHEAVGELLLAALHYAQDGAEPSFEDSSLGFAWAFLKPSIDRDGAAYDEKRQRGDWLTYCRQCKRDGVDALDFETWRERTDNDTLRPDDVALPTTTHNQPNSNINPTSAPTQEHIQPIDGMVAQPPARPRFRPPSVEEVRAYCTERGNAIDPEHFVSYYESVDWKIGKNPMKSWKSAVITWEKREGGQQHGSDNGHSQGRSAEDADSRWGLDAVVL